MGKHKSAGKKRKKASQLVIRVEKDERDAFVQRCDELDTSAAREIRRFMREWVAANAPVEVPQEASAKPADQATEADLATEPAMTEEPDQPVADSADPAEKPKRKRAVRSAPAPQGA